MFSQMDGVRSTSFGHSRHGHSIRVRARRHTTDTRWLGLPIHWKIWEECFASRLRAWTLGSGQKPRRPGGGYQRLGQLRGWTPFITACVQGHADMAEMLLRSGTDTGIRDRQGWLAKDHAAYRGHLGIVNTIEAHGPPSLSSKCMKRLGQAATPPRRASTDSVIFIHLGTLDMFKRATEHLLGGRSQPTRAPRVSPYYLEDLRPALVLRSRRPRQRGHIIFKVSSLLEKEPIGTAVALLGSLTQGLGANRESLVRDFTLPVVSDQYGHVGTAVFTFVIVRPFSRPANPAYGSPSSGTRVIIEDRWSSWHLDVQLTKDDVPAIYHDFLVAEEGCNAPGEVACFASLVLVNIGIQQFMAISDAQSASKHPSTPTKRLPWDERDRPRVLPPLRRRSYARHRTARRRHSSARWETL
ncbi:hypothetical protein ACJZ2D_007920 [Fusarium nematophilum]